MPREIFNLDRRFKEFLFSIERGDRDFRRLVFRQIAARVLRCLQTQRALVEHVIRGSDSQDLRKLLEHHQAKLVQTNQRMT